MMRVIQWSLACALVACEPLPPPPPQPTAPAAPPTEAELLASRPYALTVPAGYVAGDARPLVVVLAGYGELGPLTARWLGFEALQDSAGYFLAAPNGLRDSHGYNAWHPGPIHASQSWDVEYLLAIVHELEARYSIDPKRVFFVGHSQGAHMAHRMGCDGSTDVAALMSLAGQVTMVPQYCAPARPVSALQIHGTADEVIGYEGDVQSAQPDPSIPSAHQTVAVWARNDGCDGGIALTGATLDLDSRLPGEETTVEAYAGCPPGVAVELWSIVDGSHRPALTDGFAARVWGFLSSHPRP